MIPNPPLNPPYIYILFNKIFPSLPNDAWDYLAGYMEADASFYISEGKYPRIVFHVKFMDYYFLAMINRLLGSFGSIYSDATGIKLVFSNSFAVYHILYHINGRLVSDYSYGRYLDLVAVLNSRYNYPNITPLPIKVSISMDEAWLCRYVDGDGGFQVSVLSNP